MSSRFQGYDELLARARRTGSPFLFALLSSRRSELGNQLRGAIPDALADAGASIETGSRFGASMLTASLYARLIDASLEAGDIDGARAALEQGGFEHTLPDVWPFLPLRSKPRLPPARTGLPGARQGRSMTRSPRARPAPATRSATPRWLAGFGTPPPHWCDSSAEPRRANWSPKSSPRHGASARPAQSGSPWAPPGCSRAAPRASSCCASPSRRSSVHRHDLHPGRSSPSLAPRCGAPERAATPRRICGGRWISRTAVAGIGSPIRRAPSS